MVNFLRLQFMFLQKNIQSNGFFIEKANICLFYRAFNRYNFCFVISTR